MQGNTHVHLSLPPSHHCLDGEVYRGDRHYNVCEHVGLDTNQSLHHPRDSGVPKWYVRTYVLTMLCHNVRTYVQVHVLS
jgi:hypothetical protein